MSAPLDCPELERWQELFDDVLPPEQEARLERHLEACAVCQNRLQRVQAGSEVLRGAAQQFGDPTTAPPDPTLAHLLQRLHEVRSPVRAANEPADLYFLRPSEQPDILGTLGDYE